MSERQGPLQASGVADKLGAIWGFGAVFGRFERNRRLEFPRKLVISRVSENRVKFDSRRLHQPSRLIRRRLPTVAFGEGGLCQSVTRVGWQANFRGD